MTLRLLPSQAACPLWQADLDEPPAPDALALLSDDERARAGRFVFERDARRFMAAHAALWSLLVQQTGLPRASLDLVSGPFGKPALAGTGRLRFNLSHSHGVGLIALSRTVEVGVDVEVLRPVPDALSLAQAYFTPDECAALAALPTALRERAFLICWTRKEACLKALGVGLQLAPDSFEVGIAPVARTVRLATPDGPVRLALESSASPSGQEGRSTVFSLARRLGGPRVCVPAAARARRDALEVRA